MPKIIGNVVLEIHECETNAKRFIYLDNYKFALEGIGFYLDIAEEYDAEPIKIKYCPWCNIELSKILV